MPSEGFLAPPQPMEWLDFRSWLEVTSTRTCRFETRRAGYFDGLHMHLVVELDGETTIDTYRERTTWTCTYVRLFDAADAIWLEAGALVECVCKVDATADCPTYAIAVYVSRNGTGPLHHVADCSWCGDG
jgi:hypothetical protein